MQTPTRGREVPTDPRETPWAMKAAPCSCRDMMKVKGFCFSISSKMGMMAPPVYPNTWVTPQSLRALMTSSVPFIIFPFKTLPGESTNR
jgi:hypothetical protein